MLHDALNSENSHHSRVSAGFKTSGDSTAQSGSLGGLLIPTALSIQQSRHYVWGGARHALLRLCYAVALATATSSQTFRGLDLVRRGALAWVRTAARQSLRGFRGCPFLRRSWDFDPTSMGPIPVLEQRMTRRSR